MEHAVELLLLKDHQVIEAFLPHAPHEALADRIGSGCMIGRFPYLDAAGCGHARETGPQCVVVLANQVLGCVPIRGWLLAGGARPKNRSAIGSRLRG